MGTKCVHEQPSEKAKLMTSSLIVSLLLAWLSLDHHLVSAKDKTPTRQSHYFDCWAALSGQSHRAGASRDLQ